MKNRTRVIILVLLLLANISFLFFTKSESGVSFEEDLFVVADTAGISAVTIDQGARQIALTEMGKGWLVNKQYPADERLMKVLLSILSRVQVKKPAAADPEDSTVVSISGNDPMSFYVWGNPTKTRTYFSLEGSGAAYEVTIPGYNEYIGGIFELNADQWRDRLVMNESWRTIQDLRLDYLGSEENDFSIRFDQHFFRMDQVNQIDSSAVVDYLNQFQYFEANEWISSGRFPRYDSLVKKRPLATLKIESINSEYPIILDIYPRLGDDPFHVMMDREEAMMAVDQRRVRGILQKPEYFRNRK